MRSHGLDMIGNLLLEVESTLPTWTSADARRLIYESTNELLYYGGSAEWIQVLSDNEPEIPSGTNMWFYENAAPTGWTLVSVPSDSILGVKGGSTWTTGGVSPSGSWTVSGITVADHVLTIPEMPAHTHGISRGDDDTEAGDGDNEPGAFGNIQSTSTGGGLGHNHGVSQNGTWRPSTNVGIICIKD